MAARNGETHMLGIVATIKVKPGMEKEFEAVAKELVAKAAALDPTYFFPPMLDGWIDLQARKFGDAIPS